MVLQGYLKWEFIDVKTIKLCINSLEHSSNITKIV